MRNFTIIVALAAAVGMVTMATLQAQPPDRWISGMASDSYNETFKLGILGVDTAGRVNFSRDVAQSVGKVYHALGTIDNDHSALLSIDELWVTTASINSNNAQRTGGGVSVGKYILQIGQQSVQYNPTGGQRTADFGEANQFASDTVSLSSTGISYGDLGIRNNWGVVDGDTQFSVENFGTINDLVLSGGTVNNWGTINEADVSRGVGILNNGSAADSENNNVRIVRGLDLSSGTVNNWGTIENMTYSGGTYDNQGGVGTIGSLTVKTDDFNIVGWGSIGSLEFSEVTGVFSITANYSDGEVTYSDAFSGASVGSLDLTEAAIKVSVTGFNSPKDWWDYFYDTHRTVTYGEDDNYFYTYDSIVFDLSGVEGEYAGLFGDTALTGNFNIDNLSINWGEFSWTDFTDTVPGQGWSAEGTLLKWMSETDREAKSDPNLVPEPATLAVLGLGLAGLGVARARRRK